MPQIQVTIAAEVGLHARPAALFVKAATEQSCQVTIARVGGDPVDATSILSVLSLALGHGEQAVLSAEGTAADIALADLGALLTEKSDAAP